MKKEHNHEPVSPKSDLGFNETLAKLASNRMLFIAEDVTEDLAAQLSAMLLHFDNQDHETPIVMHIHSVGGSAWGLFNIYDVMQMIKAPIKTVCLGHCYSAAAVMLAAGTKGMRYALKHSRIMIHGIQVVFPLLGHDITNSKNYHDFMVENNDNILKMLAQHTGQPLEKIRQDCKEDVWFSPEQALEYGIIDDIIT